MADHPPDRGRQAGHPASLNPALDSPDTIAAIATAPGVGGIGVVRVSGVGLHAMALALTGSSKPLTARHARHVVFLDDQGRALDDGLMLYFPAPHSYTGEDVLELQGHGGPVVLRMLLQRCLALGARMATPGEFTRRAWLNDRLDLAQAEAVADLIDAASEAAVRSAVRSLRGEFSAQVQKLSLQLIDLRMLIEATLDFPEEDIDASDRLDAHQRLKMLHSSLQQLLQQGRQGSLLREGLSVVLAGKPNVGKSSLLNRLAGDEVAIVTEIPGTTRDTLRERIVIEGVPIHIIDTAGLRDTSDRVEQLGIERTWRAIAQADVLLQLVDAREGLTDQDQQLMQQCPAGLRRIVVENKADLLLTDCAAAQPGHIRLSARTGEGLDGLRAALLTAAGWQPAGEDVILARGRHLQALEATLLHVDAAAARIGLGLDDASIEAAAINTANALSSPELLAEDLRLAHLSLCSITGEFSADDLLGEIFSRFCIGK